MWSSVKCRQMHEHPVDRLAWCRNRIVVDLEDALQDFGGRTEVLFVDTNRVAGHAVRRRPIAMEQQPLHDASQARRGRLGRHPSPPGGPSSRPVFGSSRGSRGDYVRGGVDEAVAAADRAVGGAEERSASTTTPMTKITIIASYTPTKSAFVRELLRSWPIPRWPGKPRDQLGRHQAAPRERPALLQAADHRRAARPGSRRGAAR